MFLGVQQRLFPKVFVVREEFYKTLCCIVKTFFTKKAFTMKLDVITEKHNPLLARKEVQVAAWHPEEATPSRTQVQQLLAKQLGKEVTKIDIRNIFSKNGSSKSDIKIFIWDNKSVDDLSKAVKKGNDADASKQSEPKAK